MVTERQIHRINLASKLVVDRVHKIRRMRNRSEAVTTYTVKDFKASYQVPTEVKTEYTSALSEEMTALQQDIFILQQEAQGIEAMIIPKVVT